MREEIEKLAKNIVSDVEKVRNNEIGASERLAIEVMALNALCNAEKVLHNKCQCGD